MRREQAVAIKTPPTAAVAAIGTRSSDGQMLPSQPNSADRTLPFDLRTGRSFKTRNSRQQSQEERQSGRQSSGHRYAIHTQPFLQSLRTRRSPLSCRNESVQHSRQLCHSRRICFPATKRRDTFYLRRSPSSCSYERDTCVGITAPSFTGVQTMQRPNANGDFARAGFRGKRSPADRPL